VGVREAELLMPFRQELQILGRILSALFTETHCLAVEEEFLVFFGIL
jgi:hypothetical protein